MFITERYICFSSHIIKEYLVSLNKNKKKKQKKLIKLLFLESNSIFRCNKYCKKKHSFSIFKCNRSDS